jgi:hypothetical protein
LRKQKRRRKENYNLKVESDNVTKIDEKHTNQKSSGEMFERDFLKKRRLLEDEIVEKGNKNKIRDSQWSWYAWYFGDRNNKRNTKKKMKGLNHCFNDERLDSVFYSVDHNNGRLVKHFPGRKRDDSDLLFDEPPCISSPHSFVILSTVLSSYRFATRSFYSLLSFLIVNSLTEPFNINISNPSVSALNLLTQRETSQMSWDIVRSNIAFVLRFLMANSTLERNHSGSFPSTPLASGDNHPPSSSSYSLSSSLSGTSYSVTSYTHEDLRKCSEKAFFRMGDVKFVLNLIRVWNVE